MKRTQAQREKTSQAMKKAWAARKKRSILADQIETQDPVGFVGGDAEQDRNVIRAALLLHAAGHLSDKEIVDIVDRVFQ